IYFRLILFFSSPQLLIFLVGWLRRGPHRLPAIADATAQYAPATKHAGYRARKPGQGPTRAKSIATTRATTSWRPIPPPEDTVAARRSRCRNRRAQALNRHA